MSLEFRLLGSESWIQDFGFGVWSFSFWVESLGFRPLGLKLGGQAFVFRVLGFRLLGVEFGVQAFVIKKIGAGDWI